MAAGSGSGTVSSRHCNSITQRLCNQTMDQMADDGVVTIATTTHAPVALPNGVMVLQSTPMITSDL